MPLERVKELRSGVIALPVPTFALANVAVAVPETVELVLLNRPTIVSEPVRVAMFVVS